MPGFSWNTGLSIFNVKISSTIFDRSAPDLDSCPDESLPEFAFIGRSNVGKSTLLNFLADKRDLARVSPTPGFTKLINIFTINRTWRLVDLPGYGYAHVARKDSARFNEAVSNYLEHRANLCLVFALIDSVLPPQAIDLEFIQWMLSKEIPFVLVFTKTDKLPLPEIEANIETFMARIAPWFEQAPAKFKCSATLGKGREDLLNVIDESLKAIKVQSKEIPTSGPWDVAPGGRPAPSVRQPKKPRPDLNRPW